MKNLCRTCGQVMVLAWFALMTPPVSAAVYEAGPGQTYTNLGSIPWPSLNPGDTVNIHYQPGGYHEVILLANSGVSNAPITINGVPDPVTGALPLLDGHHAVTATNAAWTALSLNAQGVIVVSRAANQAVGSIPSWIVIQNLHLQNADPSNTLTQVNGVTNAFATTAAALYVDYAQHLSVRGCELNGSANGIFCGSANNDANTLSADVLIEHCWIHDNGFPGNFDGNEISTESEGIVLQYNLIGPLRSAADGYEIRDRSSGTILRYNTVIQGSGSAAFWFVQTQGGIGLIDTDPAYHTNFVYGNVFYNPPNGPGLTMFIYDSNGIQGQPRNGTLYFYNNTVVNYTDQSVRYYTEIFTLPSHAEVLQWNVHDVVDCRNNIFAAVPVTAGDQPTEVSLFGSDDSGLILGTNWVTPGAQVIKLPYGSTSFYGAIAGTNQLVFGDRQGKNNPGFVSVTTTNFHLLSSSPAIDAAGPQSPAVLASPNNVTYEYVTPTNAQLRAVNGLALDLGAFEGTSTNFTGPLFTLTVSNGFGSGSYPASATVSIAANPALPGQAFAGWTGYAVGNPASLGTTFAMPASNLTVTATFTNLPVPAYFPLTVVSGTGSGSYLPGSVVTITANPPASGQSFAGWSGYAVANANAATTTLTMPAGSVTVLANYQVATSFNLTVVNGTGGGVYAPGTVVPIAANSPPSGNIFAGWSGYTVANAAATSTTLTMPGADVVITATFAGTNGGSGPIPFPVSSHPRLWITTNDLPRLRSWATPTNPVYLAVRTLLTNCMINYDTQFFPGGVQNPNYPDFGDVQGYTGLITEEDALVFALFSLVDPSVTQREIYAQRAANLIRVAMNQAALGLLADAPFRDPSFATYNRANESLKLMPLAVDWIYNAVGTNGQPVLSAADKLAIRNGFAVWAEACRHASTAYGDSPIPDVYNDVSILCPNHAAYRMAANNYYIGHARMLTLMALAIDPVDDPAFNPALPVYAPTNSLRSYLSIVNGAWLFQEYAMFGEGAQVAADYGVPGYGANFGLASGGMPPEGMLYGASLGAILNQLLALQTAGFNDTNYSGPQIKLIGAPVWDRFCDAWLAALNPVPNLIESYLPPAYQMMAYGDLLQLYNTPDFSQVFSALAMFDRETGNTNRVSKTTWLALEGPEGGYADLLNRVSIPWGGAEQFEVGVLYFLTVDPATLAPPPDPRPAQPTLFFDQPQGTLVGQGDWTTNRSQLQWRCSWDSINHQNADAGMFQFLRRGEFLTKEYSGYDQNSGLGQASWLHNTLALQNYCPAGTPDLGWDETNLWTTGSQWMLAEGAGDPPNTASAGTNYVFTCGDLTPLYNRPNQWTPSLAAIDILQANRSLLWLKPDHLIVYDRATSHTAGLFKRFNLCFPAAPTVAARPGGGSLLTETMPSGQHLFINSLLPANGVVSLNPLTNLLTTVAEGEPCNYRLAIEDTNHPSDIRFLHVLQGADAGQAADATTYVQSSSGNAFEGVVVRGVAAWFPVNVLSNNFASVGCTVPVSVTNHYLAGLAPNARYAVTVLTNAGQLQISVVPGTQITADNAGLLAFNNSGQPLQTTASRWTGIHLGGSQAQLTGTGGQLLPYQVLASTNLYTTNWSAIGTATADASGAILFSAPATNWGNKFYRLAR